MNTSTESKQPAERPIPLSQTQLTTIGKFLPTGSTGIGGLVLSHEKGEGEVRLQVVQPVRHRHLRPGRSHDSCIPDVSGRADQYDIIGDTVVDTW